jgi:hypothetical protein
LILKDHHLCGASVISNDFLLTADFCVQGSPSKITLKMGASDAGPRHCIRRGCKTLGSSIQLGYAILKANSNSGSTFGRLTLATNPVIVNDELFSAHYAYGRAESFSNQCRVTRILDDSSFLHNCDTVGELAEHP